MRIVFKAQCVSRREKETQFIVTLSFFKKNKCSYLYIILCQFECWKYCFQIFLGLQLPPDLPTVFGTNQTCSPTPCFARVVPNMQYFPNHWWTQLFFNSGKGPDILTNVLKDCIIFLICAAWILLNIYLKGTLMW